MGKLMSRLEKQLEREYKNEAEVCIEIYNYLKETNNGHVWDSQWNPLVIITFNGLYERHYKPSNIGYMLLKGLRTS
jgi:hypothetical protein